MHMVFSYIIQKRFSQENEDVATDALAYILNSSEAARQGFSKLLRGVTPNLPALRFETQLSDGAIRPDMWGLSGAEPRVFVENKFWAGLTESQPVSYLKKLAVCAQPTILLVVAPAARKVTLWRELRRRLGDAEITTSEQDPVAGVDRIVATSIGPVLMLTSWTSLLSMLESEVIDDPKVRADLIQLRGLCDAADNEAFVPVLPEELSDQRTPAFVIEMGLVVQEAVDLAVTEKILSITNLRPQASWDRIGRYVWMGESQSVGAWFGIHFGFWRLHGITPLWLLFSEGDFGRAQHVRRLIEPWAAKNDILTATNDQGFAVALDIRAGEEKDGVVRALVSGIREIAFELGELQGK